MSSTVILRGGQITLATGTRKGFRQINRYVRQRLTQHVRRRSQRPFRPAEGVSYYEHFKHMGLVYL